MEFVDRAGSRSPGRTGESRRRRAAAWILPACVAAALAIGAPAQAQRRAAPEPPAAAARPAQPPRVTPEVVGDSLIQWLLDVMQAYEVRGTREPIDRFHRRVSAAVRAHPQFLGLGQGSAAAEQSVDEAWAGYLPTISGSGDGGYRRFGSTFAGSPSFDRNGLGVGAQVRQTLFDFGATSGQVEAARQRLDAAYAKRDGAELDLGLRAIQAHLDVLRYRMLHGLADRNVVDRTQIVALLQSRQELGGSGSPEVRRATARLAAARSAMVAIENRLRTAEAGYREIYGVQPEQLALPEDVEVPSSVDAAIGAARQRHPALREAKATTAAARADADVADARALPSFGVEGNVLLRNRVGDGDPATDASLLMVMRYDFYTGGADTARRNAARARSRQAEFDAAQVDRQLERAVRQAAAEAENGTRAIDARVESVLASIDALRANREQLELSRGNMTELLKVQEELFDAGRELIETVFDRSLARYRLLQLTGALAEILGSAPPHSVRVPR